MKSTFYLSLFFVLISCSHAQYPKDWWKPVPKEQLKSWEIPPQAAGPGEVILSKRTELGIFSNLGAAKFVFEGEPYGSVEGLWQMMKYPDPTDQHDLRLSLPAFQKLPYTREQVKLLSDFECKHAGDAASAAMKASGLKTISYRGKHFNYKDMAEGSQFHYDLIYRATWQKVEQNPAIKKLLLQTGDLKLRPDHKTKENSPASYHYYDILMKIREQLK